MHTVFVGVRLWSMGCASLSNIIPAISTGKFEASPIGLSVHRGKIEPWEWLAYCSGVRTVGAALPWIVGDLLNYGEAAYGEAVSQAYDLWEDYAQGTLSNWQYVAGRIPKVRRRETVGWSLHYEVAKLEPDAQDYWLDKMENGMTRAELRLELSNGEAPERHPCPSCGRVHKVMRGS